jgi:hypothetical protein
MNQGEFAARDADRAPVRLDVHAGGLPGPGIDFIKLAFRPKSFLTNFFT